MTPVLITIVIIVRFSSTTGICNLFTPESIRARNLSFWVSSVTIITYIAGLAVFLLFFVLIEASLTDDSKCNVLRASVPCAALVDGCFFIFGGSGLAIPSTWALASTGVRGVRLTRPIPLSQGAGC
jgi:hypothetical protein